MATQQVEVEEFLTKCRVLIQRGALTFVPRTKNIEGMAELGITNVEAEKILSRLTVNNYVRGPESDENGSLEDIWFFGAPVAKREAYIKMKIRLTSQGEIVVCISFHPSERDLRFPLRP